MLVIFASAFGGSDDFIVVDGVGITAAQYYLTSMIATGVMLTSFQAHGHLHRRSSATTGR